MMTIYEKLVQLRKSKGWSQEDLAEKLNVSRQTRKRDGSFFLFKEDSYGMMKK